MLKVVAQVKGWTVESHWDYSEVEDGQKERQESWGAVKRLEENWKIFQQGNHPTIRKKNNRKHLLSDSEPE